MFGQWLENPTGLLYLTYNLNISDSLISCTSVGYLHTQYNNVSFECCRILVAFLISLSSDIPTDIITGLPVLAISLSKSVSLTDLEAILKKGILRVFAQS